MKNLTAKIFLASAFALASLTSCEKLVDIAPIDELPISDLTKDSVNVQYILNGAYGLNQNMFPVWRAAVLLGDDFDVEYIASKEQGDFQFFPTFRFGPFNGITDGIWNDGYNVIGRSNLVIDAVDKKLFTSTTSTYNRLKGEALFLRATQGFYITTTFALPYTSSPTAPGMVIRTSVLTPSQAAEAKQRSSVAESYAQIEADLKEAINLLPENNSPGVDKNMAKAFLARLYFNKADYAAAYTAANELISSGTYTFAATPGDSLTPSIPFAQSSKSNLRNTGYIYAILNVNGSDKSGDFRGKFYNSSGLNSNFKLNTNPEGPITAIGPDSTQMFKQLFGKKSDFYYVKKYVAFPRNIPVIRLDEMYFNRAEAGLQTGTISTQQAIDDLNVIRKKNGIDSLVLVSPTKEEVLSRIRADRRGNMVGEPDRYYELKRLNLTVRGVPVSESKCLPKLPVAEINGNKNIQQN